MAPSKAEFPSIVHEGEVLAGKYQVLRVIGAGGMGTVVAARHMQLDEVVAVKLLHRSTLQEPEALARFAREARAAVKIKSEHVARVFDVGFLENGAPFMVMEYLEGEDLATALAARGPLPTELAMSFVLEACEAIAEAHVLGIVHRDLKPANLFAVRKPDGQISIKVLDFGVSKVTGLTKGHPDLGLTKTMAIVGSPLYMAPEQLREPSGVDVRADIWALGVILFQLLTNQTPFNGVSMADLCIQIATARPSSLLAYRRDVSPGLEATVFKCLEKNRDDRFSDVGQLAVALLDHAPESARISVERIVRTLAGASGPTSAVRAHPLPNLERAGTMPPWGRTFAGAPSRTRLAVAGAAVALVSGGAVFVVTRPHTKPHVEAIDAGNVAATALPAESAPARSGSEGVSAVDAGPSPEPTAESETPPVASAPAKHSLKKRRAKGAVPTDPTTALPGTEAPAPSSSAKPEPPSVTPPDSYSSAGRSPYDDRK